MTKENLKIGMGITYNGTKYIITEIAELYIKISAIGFKTMFKIGNEHIKFIQRK